MFRTRNTPLRTLQRRPGDVRQVGVFQNRPEILCKMAAKLGGAAVALTFATKLLLAVTGFIVC
jgi:hypothetical protein